MQVVQREDVVLSGNIILRGCPPLPQILARNRRTTLVNANHVLFLHEATMLSDVFKSRPH